MPTIQVKVKPNAKSSVLTLQEDGTYLALVKASPVDGKANAELISLVARHFGCPKSAVTIATGASSRIKRVAIDAATQRGALPFQPSTSPRTHSP